MKTVCTLLVPGVDIPGTMYRAITATTSLALPVIFKITFYEITKIVGALWLAERSVCMRVCKHGCGVKLFGFSRANHASTNLKKVRVQNSTSLLYLTIPSSAETWNIFTNKLCQFYFRLSWHFKGEKSVFWKASVFKTRTEYARKPSCTRLCDW